MASQAWTWSSWQVILILLNALCGLIAFEISWKRTYGHRHPNPEIAQVVPAFRRTDIARWRKWKFYPGAVTVMLPRLIVGHVLGLILIIIVSICMIG